VELEREPGAPSGAALPMREGELGAMSGLGMLPKSPWFTIAADRSSITCLCCGRTSYSPDDIEHRYCGFCHTFHSLHNLTCAREDGIRPRSMGL
jgi:hypothetical protein